MRSLSSSSSRSSTASSKKSLLVSISLLYGNSVTCPTPQSSPIVQSQSSPSLKLLPLGPAIPDSISQCKSVQRESTSTKL
ncbi:unnamed protein product [Prunus brigantina]